MAGGFGRGGPGRRRRGMRCDLSLRGRTPRPAGIGQGREGSDRQGKPPVGAGGQRGEAMPRGRSVVGPKDRRADVVATHVQIVGAPRVHPPSAGEGHISRDDDSAGQVRRPERTAMTEESQA
jgi:hypothetical protein